MSEAEKFWEDARHDLAGLPDGRGLNIAHEAVDRHVIDGDGERIAIRWIGSGGNQRDISYRELGQSASRFANALKDLGLMPETAFSACWAGCRNCILQRSGRGNFAPCSARFFRPLDPNRLKPGC